MRQVAGRSIQSNAVNGVEVSVGEGRQIHATESSDVVELVEMKSIECVPVLRNVPIQSLGGHRFVKGSAEGTVENRVSRPLRLDQIIKWSCLWMDNEAVDVGLHPPALSPHGPYPIRRERLSVCQATNDCICLKTASGHSSGTK